jgi:hypothetical protein
MLDVTLIETASVRPRAGRDGQEHPSQALDTAFNKRRPTCAAQA